MPSAPTASASSPEASVYARYAAAAQAVEPALCCAVSYPPNYLDAIPEEVLAKDYGCGDPTPFVRAGETVLDLGAGAGKLCFILAQVVGPRGRVIGIDCNREMLTVARTHAPTVAERLGYANVEFRYGLIQDLQLDLDQLAAELAAAPVRSAEDWLALRTREERLRRERPLVPAASVDCVVSNCVLNLVRTQDRERLFGEIFRVLRPGGRAAISDIVADRDVPARLQNDPHLWSGCISGAYREDEFLKAFEQAGFYGLQIANRQSEPWQTVEGIEFRSVTVLAYKAGPDGEGHGGREVVYRGPFKTVEDDAGRRYRRGERTAVSEGAYRLLQQAPYADSFFPLSPEAAGANRHAVQPLAAGSLPTLAASGTPAGEERPSSCGEGGCCG